MRMWRLRLMTFLAASKPCGSSEPPFWCSLGALAVATKKVLTEKPNLDEFPAQRGRAHGYAQAATAVAQCSWLRSLA